MPEINNIKYHVITEKGKPTCRLSWVGFDGKLNKDDNTHKIPAKAIRAECMDFPNPKGLYAAKDKLVAHIKKNYKNPVSIRPTIDKDKEFLIDPM